MWLQKKKNHCNVCGKKSKTSHEVSRDGMMHTDVSDKQKPQPFQATTDDNKCDNKDGQKSTKLGTTDHGNEDRMHRPRTVNTATRYEGTTASNSSSSFQKTIRKGPICSAVILLLAAPLVVISLVRTSLEREEIQYKLRDTMGGHPRVGSGSYTGRLWKTPQTLGVKLLGETPFARCDVHSVVTGTKQKKIVNDWIFLEERDAINVAVLTKEGKFLVFEQDKYAIPGSTLSPVGGFINDDESPFDAARREVQEELGVGSPSSHEKRTMSLPQLDEFGIADGKVPEEEQEWWIFLGRYRTAANRGGGFIYSYLLKDAVPLVQGGGSPDFIQTGDDEKQTLVSMTTNEVATAVAQGQFKEVKWAATMSLSLLQLQPANQQGEA